MADVHEWTNGVNDHDAGVCDMKDTLRLAGATAIVVAACCLPSCTNSPFDNDIEIEARTLAGEVELSDPQDKKAGVYIWLEGLNLSARTDAAGRFVLELPKTLEAQKISGVYRMYVFVANYALHSIEAVVQNGRFLYGQGDVLANGQLQKPIRLFKILNVTMLVDPPRVPQDYLRGIDAQVTFQATLDSVTVIIPKSVGGLLGGLFFENTETGEIHIDIPDVGARTSETIRVGTEPTSRRQIFQLNGANFRDLFLDPGNYRVTPYFFIQPAELPEGLLQSLGQDPKNLEPVAAYLQIPVRSNEAIFQVF